MRRPSAVARIGKPPRRGIKFHIDLPRHPEGFADLHASLEYTEIPGMRQVEACWLSGRVTFDGLNQSFQNIGNDLLDPIFDLLLLTVQTEPVPAWLAVAGIFVLTAVVLAYSCLRIRRLEIRYTTD